MSNAIIAIDTPPLAKCTGEVADYVSCFVYSHLSAQLFRWSSAFDGVVNCACRRYSSTPDGRTHHLHLDSALERRARPITARDYVHSWSQALTNSAPAAGRLSHIVDLTVIDCDDAPPGEQRQALEVRLSQPDSLLPGKLAHPALGPFFDWCPTPLGADPGTGFLVHTWADERIQLRHRNSGLGLEFRCIPSGHEAVRLYLSGEIDCTCPASFPLDMLPELASHPDFVPIRSNTFMVLIPASERSSHLALRRRISAAIDRYALAGRWPGCIEVVSGFSEDSAKWTRPIWPATADANQPASNGPAERPLTIAYDPFFPNAEVADLLCQHLREHGLTAETVTDNYAHPVAECDFKLMVICNSPGYQGDAYQRVLRAGGLSSLDGSRQLFDWWLKAYDSAQEGSGRKQAIEALDGILWSQLPVIPVARLNQFALCRIDGFDWHSQTYWNNEWNKA